jgi:DNA-binding NtrC family response regulator
MKNAARIIVIDDDESIRNSFSTILRNAGYEVETAETGAEAIDKSERSFYNLALIDIRLPDMEGTELLTKIKETTPKMVKIIVTGYPGLQNAVEALNKGADGYIIKPAKIDDLLKTIREHLSKQQDADHFDEEKVREFVETRMKKFENAPDST